MRNEIIQVLKNFNKSDKKIQKAKTQARDFLERFPFRAKPELIDELTPNSLYQKGSKETLFYWAEYGTNAFGKLIISQDEVYENAKANLPLFKQFLKQAVDDSIEINEKIDTHWEQIKGFGLDKHIAKKIVTLYYPDKTVHVFSTEVLEGFASKLQLNLDNIAKDKFYNDYHNLTLGQKFLVLNESLLRWRDENAAKLDTFEFTHFLYDVKSFFDGLDIISILSTEQISALKDWTKQFNQIDLEKWYSKQVSNHIDFIKILKENKFQEGKNLPLSELYKISKLLTENLGNTQLTIKGASSIFESNSLEEFNERLRDLLFGKEAVGKRFDSFIELKRVKTMTASQFLCLFDHKTFPFYANFMIEVFESKLMMTETQIFSARKEAEEEFDFASDHKYKSETIEYLTIFMVLKAIKKALNLESYFQVQNVLWKINNSDFKLEPKKSENSYFILRTGGGQYEDLPSTTYHFKQGIPGYKQLLEAQEKASFIYYEHRRGGFWANGKLGKITEEDRDGVKNFFAEINDFQEITPIDFDSAVVRTALSFGSIGRAGIKKISKEEFEAIVGYPDTQSVTPESSKTLEELSSETFIEKEMLNDWVDLLDQRMQIIFYGPPGTGKTFVAEKIVEYFVANNGSWKLITFHPSYSYEDFIEGIKPKTIGEKITYEISHGTLKMLVEEAKKHLDKKYALLIDEINRGNMAKIFGELIHCLEYRGEKHKVCLSYSKEDFYLPTNIYIIGTMNSADRSIALVDIALRRRFCFIDFMPDTKILQKWLDTNKVNIDKNKVVEFMERINKEIASDGKLGKHYQVGHSYFMRLGLNEKMIDQIWRYDIRPLLEEYYFEEILAVEKLEKIFNETFHPTPQPTVSQNTGVNTVTANPLGANQNTPP